MKQSRIKNLITFAFALGSVTLAWQFVPAFLKSLAISSGAVEGSLLYQILVNGGRSFILVSIAWAAVRLYEDIVWRWVPWFGCKRGWWVYGLIARREKGPFQIVEIVGFFHLLHTSTEARIKPGFAFYFENGQVNIRAHWHADCVWIGADQIQLLFDVHTLHPGPEAIAADYEGYMSLSSSLSNTLKGSEGWKGYFYDLGDRREVAGEVYAERLSPFWVHKGDKAEEIMRKYAEKLVKRAYTH